MLDSSESARQEKKYGEKKEKQVKIECTLQQLE